MSLGGRLGQIAGDLPGAIRLAVVAGAADNYRNGTVGMRTVESMDQLPTLSGVYFRFNDDRPDVLVRDHSQNALYFGKCEDAE